MSESIQTRTPAYVPYQTLDNFLKDHKNGFPNRLDSKVLERISGTLRSQLLSALKFLGLITEDKSVTPELRRLAHAEGDERKNLLGSVLRKAYPFLFNEAGFDLEHTSETDFRKQFEKAGVSGDVARKCITFFLLAAADADIKVSEWIPKPSQRTAAKVSRQKKLRPPSDKKPAADSVPPRDSHRSLPPNTDTQAVIRSFKDLFLVVAEMPNDQQSIVVDELSYSIRLLRGRP